MIPAELFIDAYRDRLRALRHEAMEASVTSLRNARNTDAIVHSGRAQAFEECLELIHKVIEDAQRN